MADEPSIDEILESLDHLLKDGSGRNDDFSDDGRDETSDAEPLPESQEDDAQAPIEPEREDPGDMAKIDDSPAFVAKETPELESLTTDMDDSAPPRRMLLSESMLLDNAQEHLPFGNDAEGDEQKVASCEPDAGKEGTDIMSAQASIMGDVDIEKLLHDVSDELVQRLHERLGEVLPGMVTEMVEDAMRRHFEKLKSRND